MIDSGYEPHKPYFSLLAQEKRNESHIGKRSMAWKGGRLKDKKGYIQIWMPEHPNARMAGYIHEHRFVMSEFLKRPLLSEESIHHINGIKDELKGQVKAEHGLYVGQKFKTFLVGGIGALALTLSLIF